MNNVAENFDLANLKNYKIIELLAQGGMGKVYLAKDIRLNRIVAIKSLKTHNSASASNIALKEAQVLAQLNQANIVQIFDIIQADNQILLVMEYINGRTLQQIIKEGLPTLTQKLSWLCDISKGLVAAHEKGIIHCDLKPSNIMIGDNNEAKITDFGIAHLEIEEIEPTFSFASQSFMSPEQSTGEKLDFKSDLFSFGILMYVLITGSHPFQSKTDSFQQEISAFDIIPKLPQDLAILIDQLLKTNKADRPSTTKIVFYKIKQLLVMLNQREALEQETISLSNIESQSSTSNHAIPKTSKKNLSLLKWLSVIAVVTIIAFYSRQKLISKPEISYVVVLRPTISGNSEISDLQKNLIIASVDNAVREMVINAKNMRLISRKEVDALSNDISQISKVTGATELLSLLVDCENYQCNVTFSRLEGKTGSVRAQKQWPIPFESFNEIHSSTQFNFSLLYPKSKNIYLEGFKSTGSDFEEYIRLYSKIRFSGYDSKKAISDLESLLKRSPYLYSAYGLFREVILDEYSQTKNIKFLKKLEETLNSAPNDYRKSILYFVDNFWLSVNTSDFIQAKEMIDKIKLLGADNSTIYELQAKLFLSNNKIEKAIKSYKKALELRPSTTLLYNLSLCYWWIGDVPLSKKTAQKLLKITPDDYSTRQLLASLSLFQGDLKSAINIYEKIIQKNPKSIDLNNLAIAYSLNSENQKALQFANKAVKLAPSNPTWLLNLADIELILGNEELSFKHYRQVIELHNDRDDLKSWLESSQAFVHLGQNELSIRALNQARKISANNAEVMFTAAIVYALLGEQISAVIHVEEALNNNIGSIWFNLPWFDSLCNNQKFVTILTNIGNTKRCEGVL